MNTLLAILKVTDARRDVILAGGLNHRFPWPWRHLPHLPAMYIFRHVARYKTREYYTTLRADVCKYRPEVGKIKFLKNPKKIM